MVLDGRRCNFRNLFDAGNDAADLRANWAQSGGTKNEQDIDMMMSHALEPRIAARTLRVCVHDERKATMLQRIFRRLDTGDGRTMDDLGLLKMQGGAEGATTRACRLTAAAMCWPLHRR